MRLSSLSNSTQQPGHTLHLWLSTVRTYTAELSIHNILSSTEKERLSLIKSPNKRQEYMASRKLMRHALSQQFRSPTNGWNFIERPKLPLEVSNLPPNTYISLSHSKGLICFAISNSPVGVDVEFAKKDRDFLTLAKIFMNREELQYLEQNTDMQPIIFYRTWCAKEAYYKAIPCIEQHKISYKDIPTQLLIKNETDWSVTEGKVGDFFLSAMAKNKPQNVVFNYFLQESNSCLFTPHL